MPRRMKESTTKDQKEPRGRREEGARLCSSLLCGLRDLGGETL